MDIPADAIHDLLKWAVVHEINFVVVGPEVPLVAGIQNLFSENGIPVFGPSRDAAQLEGSKIFTKQFCESHHVPTAAFHVCTSSNQAEAAIDERDGVCVIKADGLAAGKGVYVCHSRTEAMAAVHEIMVQEKFGSAGARIIVEDMLVGEEASIMAICDGTNFLVMESSQDHKALSDGDKGPNTGGMGAYSPAPVVDDRLINKVQNEILKPVVDGMKTDGIPFVGVLYAGVMVLDGQPYLLEINVRFGDPETQPVLMRLESDLLEIMLAAVNQQISTCTLRWCDESAVCIVAASGGYPGSYEKGKTITGLDSRSGDPDIMVFHAGTAKKQDNIVTAGGRVLGITALGKDVETARNRAYESLHSINFDGMYFRKDIAWRGMNR